MSFIKFGNHVIAPVGSQAASLSSMASGKTPDPVNEALNLARLLQSKVKELERTVAERKARRRELREAVTNLDKKLVALREEDAKEGDKLAKFAKRWNKTTPTDTAHHHEQPYTFGRPRDLNAREERFVCPTTQAASAFNGGSERYRDSYSFPSPWKPAPPLAASSSSFSIPSSPAAWDYSADDRSSFHFTASPERLDIRREEVDSSQDATPTKYTYRAALCDIRNTPQEPVAEGNGRKRKSAAFERDEHDGPYKRTRAAEAQKYGPQRRGGRRNSRRNTEMLNY